MKKLPLEDKIKDYFENPLMHPITMLITFIIVVAFPFFIFGF